MIQKDRPEHELWLVGDVCGQLLRATRGHIAACEELVELATGTVGCVMLGLGDSRPVERSVIVIYVRGGHAIASRTA